MTRALLLHVDVTGIGRGIGIARLLGLVLLVDVLLLLLDLDLDFFDAGIGAFVVRTRGRRAEGVANRGRGGQRTGGGRRLGILVALVDKLLDFGLGLGL